ncbi:MAG: recombinase family protein [Chloroflexota bacterium]
MIDAHIEVRRVATYERVSSEDQRERETIKTQTEQLARRLDSDPTVLLVDRYVDDGVSGTIPLAGRPEGQRLLADARLGRFDELWVYKIDRLGRDDVDPLLVRRELENLGIIVYSVCEGVSDPFIYSIHVAFAAQARRDFLRKSADGMARAAGEGRYTGGIVPLGYVAEGKKPNVKLVPSDKPMWADLTEADVVRRIYNRLAIDGWSCRKIAEELNALSVPTAYQKDGRGVRGKKTECIWRAGRVRNLVVNTVYKGVFQYGRRTSKKRELISAEVPALVSEEIWQAAQDTLAHNRVIAKNTPKHYLLSGTIKCAHCGKHYSATHGRDTIIWWRCNGRLTHRYLPEERCQGKGVKGTDIETAVWHDVETFLRNPGEVIQELAVNDSLDSAAAIAEAERTTLEAAIREKALERDRMIDAYRRGIIPIDDLDSHLKGIEAKQRELESRVQSLQPEVEAVPEDLPDEDMLTEIRQRLDAGLDDKQRQEIVQLLVRQITIYTEAAEGKRQAKAVIEYRFPGAVSFSPVTPASRNYTKFQRVVAL